tara:strand:- start:338 stop:571 length:234 start_codon:yes stop_codon:yes gene_type:complete
MHNKRLIPVKDSKSLFRDEETGAILNKDETEYLTYIENRKKLLSDKERINNLENQLTDVRSDINDIKNMLLKVLKDS